MAGDPNWTDGIGQAASMWAVSPSDMQEERAKLDAYLKQLEDSYKAKMAELNDREAKINEMEKPKYTQDTMVKVAMMQPIPSQCPECLDTCEITVMADHLRVRIRHHKHITCSRSLTDVIRPLAQFTVFI